MAHISIGSLFERVEPYTYLSLDRLDTLRQLCEYLNTNNIAGDIVECGTYKGGSAAVLSKYMGDNRHLWLYDSFEGMPEITEKDGKAAKDWIGKCRATPEQVKEVMQLVETSANQYTLKKGWFEKTFQESTASQVALLHCDADWYQSVKDVLEKFYPLISEGGCVVLDDFGYWEGCREAFYDFCYQNNQKPLLERVGTTQAFWIKGKVSNRTAVPLLTEPFKYEIENSNRHNSRAFDSSEISNDSHGFSTQERLEKECQILQIKSAKLQDENEALKEQILRITEKWKSARSSVKKLRKLLKAARGRARDSQKMLTATQVSLEELSSTITAIQSSKFWLIRSKWMQIKSLFQLKTGGSKSTSTVPSSNSISPTPVSPLTGKSDTRLLATYSTDKIIQDWQKSFGIDISGELPERQTIYFSRCNQTNLKFFTPLSTAGSSLIYEKLGEFEWYYMSDKWEYSTAISDLENIHELLEIGSGHGYFLEKCKAAGIHARGIELNQNVADFAKSKGLTVDCVNLQEFVEQFQGYFDAICSFQVLEHLTDPKRFLQQAIQLLKPGGQMVLCVPNANSFLKYQYCLLDMPPHHMHRWDVKTFKSLEKILPVCLERFRYEPLASYHADSYLNSYVDHFRSHSMFGKIIFNDSTIPIYKRILKVDKVRKFLKGQSLYVIFRKK